MKTDYVTLDVCEDIRSGKEPFTKIMAAVARLEERQGLCLRAPFEPKPLFGLLARKGFSHRSTLTQDGFWEILFDPAPAAGHPPAWQKTPGAIAKIDARGLEPPQPMVAILEALSQLPAGAELHACTDRRPMHLYPLLEQEGFLGETQEQGDGSFITRIGFNENR